MRLAQKVTLMGLLLLSACASPPAEDITGDYGEVAALKYFPLISPEERGMTGWWEMFAQRLETFEEPSIWEATRQGQGTDTYRVLFFNYKKPIHIVRVDVKPDGTADVTIKRNLAGAGMLVRDRAEACKKDGAWPLSDTQGERRNWERCAEDGILPTRMVRIKDTDIVGTFQNNIGWERFWAVDIGEAQAASIEPVREEGEGDQICLHSSQFVFEALVDGEYRVLQEDTCFPTNVGGALVPAFYTIANLGPESADWTWYDYYGMGETKGE